MPLVSISVVTKSMLDQIVKLDKRTQGLAIAFMCEERLKVLNLPPAVDLATNESLRFKKPQKQTETHNTAILFCREALIKEPTYKIKIGCSKIYEIYCQWCMEKEYYALNDVHFGKAIALIFPDRRKIRAHNPGSGERQLYFLGIDYKDSFVLPEYKGEDLMPQPEPDNDEYPDEDYPIEEIIEDGDKPVDEDDNDIIPLSPDDHVITFDPAIYESAKNNKAINDQVIADAEALRAKKLAEKAQ